MTHSLNGGQEGNIIYSPASGFYWNGVWHEVRPSAGEDDGPPTGVRQPRRPRPPAPPAPMALPVPVEREMANA